MTDFASKAVDQRRARPYLLGMETTHTNPGNEMKTETEFIVMDSCAAMPSSCWGSYRRVALVEVVKGERPGAIDERFKSIVQIAQTWERLHVGKTSACAYGRALKEARELCADENKRLARNARRRAWRHAKAIA